MAESTPSPRPEAVHPAPLDDPNYHTLLSNLNYLNNVDLARVKAAYTYSAQAHAHQKRASGAPYVTHPLAVANTIVEWHMDADAVIAALLHDVIEDTGVSKQELAQQFGKTVANLVDGLSKLDKIEFSSYQEAQAENFRKMLMAMASDLRVVLIKLADRHHNMSTLGAMRLDKRQRISRETLEIYAPIANRLGLHKLFRDLQDMSFANIHPLRAKVLQRAMIGARGKRKDLFARIQDAIRHKLAEARIAARVFGREKSLYSIYQKMQAKHLSFRQVLDVYGLRVVVEDNSTCYLVLGILHSLYKPVPGRFKDYIAIPRANGYQSLHTTLVGPYGTPVEVQIRTEEMHCVAQDGVAAHWLYKDIAKSSSDLHLKTHKWLQSLLDMQQGGDSSEFFENVKIDLFPDEVYVFTPKGKIMAMPRGATAVDFAYMVHTDIGNRCIAVKINHELAPLRSELKNGDVVEIVTASHANPNPAWLSYVRTGRARSKIRHFLKTMHHEESAILGERLLDQELLAMGVSPADVPPIAWEHLVQGSGKHSIKEIFTDIGLGKRLAAVAARRLLAQDHNVSVPLPGTTGSLIIRGTEGVAIQLAKCCQPIPGDPIIGSIRKGQGLIVHTHDCPSIRKSRSREPGKWIDVEWEAAPGKLFDVRIRLEVKNDRGVLAKVAGAIAEADANIENVSMQGDAEHRYSSLHFIVQVANRVHLAQVMRKLRNLPEVARIAREREEDAA